MVDKNNDVQDVSESESLETNSTLELASPELTTDAIETAAKDWMPDQELAAEAPEQAESSATLEFEAETMDEHDIAPAAMGAPQGPVAFVADPFGMSSQDVRDAQNAPDEIDVIDDSDLSDEDHHETEQSEEVDAIDMSQLRAQAEESETESESEPASEPVLESESEPESAELLAEAEREDEAELPEQDPAEVEAELERIASAVQENDRKHEESLQELAPDQAEEAAKLLAAQIAEDQALAQAELAEQESLDAELDPELAAALPKAPVADEHGNLDLAEIESCLEALLFMTDKPMSLEKLQELLGPDFSHSLFQEAMTSLRDRYQRAYHGIELVEVAGGFQFRTKPGRAALAKKLAKIQTQRLSGGAMETLAIVAYKQPVLKDEIDKIRGVDSSHFIRGLMDKKLIRISGRSDLPGRPMLYSTTSEFLELFSLKDLSAMPSLRELEQMIPTSQSRNPDDEDPRVKEMRRLVGEMKADTSTTLLYDPREDEKFLKDIRERVNSIPTSTPYVEQQKALEKQAAEGGQAVQLVPGLEALTPVPPEALSPAEPAAPLSP